MFRIYCPPLLLSVLLLTAGCGGGGDGGTGDTPDGTTRTDGDVAANASVSGQLLPAPDTVADVTLNDARSDQDDNGTCDQAEAMGSGTMAYGFASAAATGGDPALERYAASANPSDFYRVTLGTGDTLELEVADPSMENNLDLYLWNSDCSKQLDSSTGGGERESVTSVAGGEAVVEVRAAQGISKYALRPTQLWSSGYKAEELVSVSSNIPDFAKGEVILQWAANADPNALTALNETLIHAFGLKLEYSPDRTDRPVLATMASEGVAALPMPPVLGQLRLLAPEAYERLNALRIMDFLEQQPMVARAEPNFLLHPSLDPNDEHEEQQWHYPQIELEAAWDTTTGTSTGSGPVVVAILDTGVFLDHEDLRGKILKNSEGAVVGHDFHAGDTNPDDENLDNGNWHGTHVAGTVAAETNNGLGVAGVSWHAQIMPVRVINKGGGTSYAVMQGVRYAAGMPNDSGTLPARTADVINLSLGGEGYSAITQELYATVREKHIFVVAAAGNESTDTPSYPAAYDGVISVSATTCNDGLASYSNHGPTITLAAPGGDEESCGSLLSGQSLVLSTIGEGSGDQRTSAYGSMMGTSMAAPHVSGVLALMRAVNPQLAPAGFDRLLADGQITDDLGASGRDNSFGHGRINARKAVAAADATVAGAQVVAQPISLHLGLDSEATLELRQDGAGEAPGVTGSQTSDAWLQVSEVNVDERGFGTYQVQIDRSGFSEDEKGEHHGALTFALQDGDEVLVPVDIQVGRSSAVAPVYVLLLNANTGEAIYETEAEWTSNRELRYTFPDIAAGSYVLQAGSDIDYDGILCQPGEICGAWSELAKKKTLTVSDDAITDADFVLDILSQFRPFVDDPTAQAVARP